MRTRVVVLIAAAFLALTASPARAGTTVLRATLTGAAVPRGGDPAGSGLAYAVIDDDADRICVLVVSRGISPATLVHIHQAPVGEVGPHAIDLKDPVAGAGGSVSLGCYTAPEAVLDDLTANPQNYYVNVHNAVYPLGALRGQLSAV